MKGWMFGWLDTYVISLFPFLCYPQEDPLGDESRLIAP